MDSVTETILDEEVPQGRLGLLLNKQVLSGAGCRGVRALV
jgi:hypothetical protein